MSKVLIIEDNMTFREVFKKALSEELMSEIVFFGVGSIQSAEKFIKALKPDLIFIDINLPDGSGINYTKKIKDLHPNIKIIVISFYDSPEYVTAAIDNGADSFISKRNIDIISVAKMLSALLIDKNDVVNQLRITR
ncbi:MAG: response regulator [Gammaproteobacteria bacterium]